MTEALVIWVFLLLVQQQGMVGGAGADYDACIAARAHSVQEVSDIGLSLIAQSDCVPLKLEPVKPS